MDVDLRHMRQFVAVAETLHFGRAAAALGMAQPPLSQAIKRLETSLGLQLFERSKRRVELTAAGEVFLAEARRTLAQADAAVQMTRRAAADDLAHLTIAFVSAALNEILPRALSAFRARHPAIAIKLDEQPTDRQVALLRAGDIDVGLLTPPIPTGDDERASDSVSVRVLRRDPLVVAVPATSRFAGRTRLELADLAEAPFIHFPRILGPVLYDRIIVACRRAGFLPRIEQEAPRMATITCLVGAGMGVALVPAGARTMRAQGVAFVELAGLNDDLSWDLAVAWCPRRSRRATRSFIDVLDELQTHQR